MAGSKKLILAKISDLYRIGLSCSIIPSLSAAFLVIDTYVLHLIELMTFVLVLCITFPLSLIGLSSIVTGLKLAVRMDNTQKIRGGNYSLTFAVILFIGQLCSFVFAFLKII